MKIAMNMLLWAIDVNESHLPTMGWLKQIGYDGVELPIFAPNDQRYQALGRALDDLGLGRTAVTIRGADDNPISPDRSVRERGVAANKAILDSCAAGGITLLCGPMHSALGVFTGRGPTSDEWKWGVESMQQVAAHAESVGVELAVEPINRFECYLLNSLSDAARFVRDVGHPHCRMMMDTFHAHIEEKAIGTAILGCSSVLGHVHVSENDRSTPGQGSVAWPVVFDTLCQIGYSGWLAVEAFGMAYPELVAAAKIWRKMFDSQEQLAQDTLAFIKQQLRQRSH